MPRYYFHIALGAKTIRDEEGTELADIDAARSEALQDARAIMSEAIRQGYDVSGRSIRIADEAGKIILVVPFASAITNFD
jgi:hypothetical protein